MGADGHLLTLPVDKVPERFADLDPERIRWYRREFHGLDLLYSYWDTDGRGESYGDEFHEVPQRIEWLKAQIEKRGQPDWRASARPGTYRYLMESAPKLQQRLDALLAKYSPEDLALAERYADFNMWLQGAADDWTVWT